MKVAIEWLRINFPRTIWHKEAAERIPSRFRPIVLWILPPIYLMLTLFGFSASIVPIPTFQLLVGTYYGTVWAAIVGCSALFSLVSIIFRIKSEMYSSIILTFVLGIYPAFVLYTVIALDDLSRFAIIFGVAIYPIMPGWRVVDLVLKLRKARQRQLYAIKALGG